MPKFSQESFSKLSTCHPDLQVLFYEVIKYCDCEVLEGYRSQEDQEAAFQAGNTMHRYPYGKHNGQPSTSVDVAPIPLDSQKVNHLYWFIGYVFGTAQKLKDEGKITHGIRSGANWLNDYQHTKDLIHFELIE